MAVLAILGAGYWGKNLVRNFAQLEGARLKYVCDRDPSVLARLRPRYPGVQFIDDPATVFRDVEVEGVVVAAPAVAHHALAREALLAGKHCYVEKPLALSLAHAQDLIGLSRDRGRALMVGHLLRYHPALPKLKELLDSGDLGRLHYLYSRRLNLGIIRKDENALFSLAPHDISMQVFLVGALPESVTAHGASFVQPGIEDVVFATLKFPGGVLGHIHVSWLDPQKVRSLTLVGSQRMVTFDDVEPVEKIRVYGKSAERPREYESFGEAISVRFGDVTSPRLDMVEPLMAECRHFAHCVETGERPLTDGEDGLRVLRVLLAAQESLRRGGEAVSP